MNIPRLSPIDTSIVQRMRKLRPAKNITDLIVCIVRNELGVDPLAYRHYRGERLVTARFMFMVFMVKYSKETYKLISSVVGKDHATVNHAIKKVQDLCDTDPEYKLIYDRIDYKIKSNLS